MFGFLKKMFKKKEEGVVKVTTTSNEEVIEKKIHPTIAKMRNNKDLNVTDISLLLSDIYDKKAITTKYHKLHKVLVEDAVFEINNAKLFEDDNGEFTVWFELIESIYGIKMGIQIDPGEFHDVFKEYAIKPIEGVKH